MAIVELLKLNNAPNISGSAIPSVEYNSFFEGAFNKLGSDFIREYIEYAIDLADSKRISSDRFKEISRGKHKQHQLRDTLIRSIALDAISNGGENRVGYEDHVWHTCDICGYSSFDNNDVAEELIQSVDSFMVNPSISSIIERLEEDLSTDLSETEFGNYSVFICSYGASGLRLSDISEYNEYAQRDIMNRLDEYLSFVSNLVYALSAQPSEFKKFSGDIDGAYEYLKENSISGKPFGLDDNIRNMLGNVLGRVDECSSWLKKNFKRTNEYSLTSEELIFKAKYGYIASSLSGEFSRTNYSEVDEYVDPMSQIGRMMKFLFGNVDGNYSISIDANGGMIRIENFVYSGIVMYRLDTIRTDYTQNTIRTYNGMYKSGGVGSLDGDNDYRFALRAKADFYPWTSLGQ